MIEYHPDILARTAEFEATLLGHIRKMMGEPSYERLIAPLRAVYLDEDAIWLKAPDVFLRDEIKEGYMDLFAGAFELMGTPERKVVLLSPEDEVESDRTAHGSAKKKEEDNDRMARSGEQLTLKLHSTESAIPNHLARSALFAVVERGGRQTMKEEKLASWEGVDLVFSGEQFDQADLDVWLAIVRLAHEQDSLTIRVSGYELLTRIQHPAGGSNYLWLRESLRRMKLGAVEVRGKRVDFMGSLVDSIYHDKVAEEYVLCIDPQLLQLFGMGYSRIDLHTRTLLSGSLTKWLATYFSSHRATEETPHYVSVKRLYELSGSSFKRLRDFRRKIKGCLDQLIERGVIAQWWIDDNDCVHIVRASRNMLGLHSDASREMSA